ncbi:MAG: DUF418 domain-containing protein [Chitinophagaceae bacterium]|nr:DUF418 domain-containing protein [Chitinophagaceae bacterium]
MPSSTSLPVQQNQRTAILDILRGWALLGVVLMNYADHYYLGLNFKTFKPDIGTSILMGFGNVVFAAKSWTMLSFLFGYGFAVLMKNVFNEGINGYVFFSRRMFWLFVLAIINSAFFFGDILKDYAVMGMVLLLFYRCSAKTALYISIGLLLILPAVSAYVQSMSAVDGLTRLAGDLPLYQSHNIFKVLLFGLIGTYKFEILTPGYLITVHVVMLACFMLGMATQKIDFFNRLVENKKYVKRTFWSTLVFALLMVGYFIASQKFKWGWNKYYQPGFLFILSSMFFIVSSICWLYVAGKLKRFFRAMQTIGKMTLTNYITQNVLAVILFSGFGFGLILNHRMHFGFYLMAALSIYIAQVNFSQWWLIKYNYGPIEWIWRQLSYARRLPIKKQVPASEQSVQEITSVEPQPF